MDYKTRIKYAEKVAIQLENKKTIDETSMTLFNHNITQVND